MNQDTDPRGETLDYRESSDRRPDIADLLVCVDGPERKELLRELIQLELWWRRHEVPAPSEEEYCRRFADNRLLVTEAFEQFRKRFSAGDNNSRSTGSEATLVDAQSFAPVERPTLPPDSNCDAPERDDRLRYFGDYELLEEIARGGMGVVFKARQIKLNRVVALKMILSGNLAAEEEILRFKTEAEAAANLDHPGIVPIYEIGEHNGQHYFSMGYVEGQSLAKRVKNGPLPPREAAEIVSKVARAVAHAHDKGVIHRDLKPANVMLDANVGPRVTDFGLAKQVESASDLTRTGAVMGTPSYMPPEQAGGKTDDVGPRSDVYSLGAILYCLLTGRPPFQSANPMDTLLQVLRDAPIPPRELTPRIAVELDVICLKCLEKDQDCRYGSATELARDLEAFLNDQSISAKPSGLLRSTWRWYTGRQDSAVLVAGGYLLITGLILTIWNLLGFVFAPIHERLSQRLYDAWLQIIASSLFWTIPSIFLGYYTLRRKPVAVYSGVAFAVASMGLSFGMFFFPDASPVVEHRFDALAGLLLVTSVLGAILYLAAIYSLWRRRG
ncbi:Serine/threonine-protein kinase PknB [Maioricimonas rarisocia]|uniref:non-specific serine/threonine protein kinase n=1 Tax=Maioricimonas rarisocia TaxID=2528026 RepID=A0A517ZED3_9PLAN|nr:serine/threonine-protein kinase [Maioricimonas rarisocia]QDU40836.1 Serine/threonine-protein kinase PknB [Maioricimonas rarisocia]